MQPDIISVLIVNFFKSSDIRKNITRILSQQGNFRVEILILDNSCDEQESKALSNLSTDAVKVFISDVNLGYTRGVNLLARKAIGNYYFLMSPDISLNGQAVFSKLLDKSKTYGDSLLSPDQRNIDGSNPQIYRRFPTITMLLANRLTNMGLLRKSSIADTYCYSNSIASADMVVDWIQSSSLFMSQSHWETVGGLDETYYIFMADVALGNTAKRKGLKMRTCRDIIVYADGLRASRTSLFKLLPDLISKGALYWHLRDATRYFIRKPR